MNQEKCEDVAPKVFVSYSWNNKAFALELSEKLQSVGIHVIIDEWNLKAGQDMYYFMETCVSDATINKVIVLADKKYAEKANERRGGVGAETALISDKVYNDSEQTKFIPVALEIDESGKPFLPLYLQSRRAIDLSKRDLEGEGFEELVRAIYGKSSYLRPPLGARPAWLNKGDGSITDAAKAFISPSVTNRSNTPFETFLYELSSASKRAFAFTAASSEKQIKLLQYDAIDRYPQIVNHYYEVVNLIPRPHLPKDPYAQLALFKLLPPEYDELLDDLQEAVRQGFATQNVKVFALKPKYARITRERLLADVLNEEMARMPRYAFPLLEAACKIRNGKIIIYPDKIRAGSALVMVENFVNLPLLEGANYSECKQAVDFLLSQGYIQYTLQSIPGTGRLGPSYDLCAPRGKGEFLVTLKKREPLNA